VLGWVYVYLSINPSRRYLRWPLLLLQTAWMRVHTYSPANATVRTAETGSNYSSLVGGVLQNILLV
jgi:hypothetical protein